MRPTGLHIKMICPPHRYQTDWPQWFENAVNAVSVKRYIPRYNNNRPQWTYMLLYARRQRTIRSLHANTYIYYDIKERTNDIIPQKLYRLPRWWQAEYCDETDKIYYYLCNDVVINIASAPRNFVNNVRLRYFTMLFKQCAFDPRFIYSII